MDEYLEGLCDSCKSDVESSNKCNRCGKDIGQSSSEVNKSFDEDKFKEMAGE